MTEKDKKLIEEANKLIFIDDWQIVDKMANEAESKEARQILHDKASWMYHIEEYNAGLL